MAKYRVVIAWYGVRRGQIIDLDEVHPSLAANVRKVEVDAEDGAITVDLAAVATEEALHIVAEAQTAVTLMIDEAKAESGRILEAAHTEAQRIRAEAAAHPKGQLTPSTPGVGQELTEKDRKALIVARLKELTVEHDGRKGADELAMLLPPGELFSAK